VALRIPLFAGLAVPGLAAIIHGRVISVKAGARKGPIALGWIIATAVLNAAGALVYAAKVRPKFPGRKSATANRRLFLTMVRAYFL